MKKFTKRSNIKYDFKISLPMWNDKCKLPDGLDIQDCFDYIIKKHETLADKPPLWIYINEIENKITFQKNIKKLYKNFEFKKSGPTWNYNYLELL